MPKYIIELLMDLVLDCNYISLAPVIVYCTPSMMDIVKCECYS